MTLVTTLTSLAATPMPRSSIPPRAVSRTATSRPGVASTSAAPAGPEKSPSSTVSPMTTTPEVELHAVFRPAVMAMWATRRVVVVLPLVPVTETTGTEGERTGEGPPGSSVRIRCAASATTASTDSADPPSSPSRAASTGPSASPARRPQLRWRHGMATTISSTVPPGRVRTVIRLGPTPPTTRRVT